MSLAYIMFDVAIGAEQDIDLDANGLDDGSRFAKITILVTRALPVHGEGNDEFPALDALSPEASGGQAP
jgi:hypothetical protein